MCQTGLTRTWDRTTAQAGILELEAFVERMAAEGQAPPPLEIVVKDLQVSAKPQSLRLCPVPPLQPLPCGPSFMLEDPPWSSRAVSVGWVVRCKKSRRRVFCARVTSSTTAPSNR